MPMYDYRCPQCAAKFMVKQEFTDDSIPDCPVCEKPMQKEYKPTPAIFRGTGWGKN
jgi:putative FmdB family regulatory protein